MEDYQKEAQDFLTKHGMEFKAIFIRHGSMSWDEMPKQGTRPTRDIYTLILTRWTGGLPEKNTQLTYVCREYGQSIAHSGKMNPLKRKTFRIPTAYDLLTSITKSDPGSFEEFCSEFGYDEDSRRAYAVWHRVCDDWNEIRQFFTKEQLEELHEIQ